MPVRILHARRLIALAALSALAVPAGRADADEEAPYDAVIIGGGPAGYAAALAAHQRGARRVLVLEKRDPAQDSGRVQNLAIEKSTLTKLKGLGVDVADRKVFTKVSEFVISDPAIGLRFEFPVSREPLSQIRASRTAGGVRDMFVRRDPMAVASIDDLQDSLRQVALRTPGIEVIDNVEATDIEHDEDGVTVRGRTSAGDRPRRASFRGDYVVVAAGRKSAAALGIDQKPRGETERLLSAVFEQPFNGRGLLTWVRDGKRSYRVLVGGGPNTTITADIPKDVDIGSQAELTRFAFDAARRSGAFPAGSQLDLVRPPTGLESRLNEASRALLGPKGNERVFVVGDALATVTPWAGLGVNVAVHAGVEAGEVIGRLRRAGTPRARAAARHWFADRMRSNTFLLHTQARMIDHATHAAGLRNPLSEARTLLKDGHSTVRGALRVGGGTVSSRLRSLKPGGRRAPPARAKDSRPAGRATRRAPAARRAPR